jgi:gliding motility-associated-like protein
MRRFFYSLLFGVIAAAFTLPAIAQTCAGSIGAPVVSETFGAGKSHDAGPPLPNGETNLTYIAADNCGGEDGSYSILTAMGPDCKGGTWQSIAHDHTGDPNGYMMIINASIDPSLFFTYRVDGSKLCPNTTYEFAAYIENILRPLPQTQGYSEPNISFIIEAADGTPIKTYNTGDIPATDDAHFVQYGTLFTSPADGSDVIVKMLNNGKGGNGNDLAMDDITVSPCGPLIQTGFGTIDVTTVDPSCANDNVKYTLVGQQAGYAEPTYQWQVNKNDGAGWIDIPGAITTSYNVNIPNAAEGKYQYRMGVLSKGSLEKCRIYSDPLVIFVFSAPTYPLPLNTGACAGGPLQLRSSGGDSYLWTGPNNYTSTDNSPVVTNNANSGFDGVYTIKITKNGCPFFASTTVKVYQPATIVPLGNTITICEGSSTQLSVQGTNITQYKWTPSTGLDHDDISNPVATPVTTTTYTATVNNDGCPDVQPETSVTVSVLKKPFANAGPTIKMFEGESVKIAATAQGDQIKTYWTPSESLDDPNSVTPLASPTANITYTLHVESTFGCGISTSSVYVRVYKKLTVANTFTPNGDGINDYWNIKNIDDYPQAAISVFTRYGEKVFESNAGYSKPWDGNYNGKKLPAGTYYYIIDLKDDGLPKQSGWLFIAR